MINNCFNLYRQMAKDSQLNELKWILVESTGRDSSTCIILQQVG